MRLVIDVSTPWIRIVPASTTTRPDTTRLAVPLSSCSLRTASCHDGGPPRSRSTIRSTSHGSNAATPTSRNTLPTASASAAAWSPDPGDKTSVPSRNTTPMAVIVQRHHIRRRTGLPCRTTPSGSTIVRRSPNSAEPTARPGTSSAITSSATHDGVKSSGNTRRPNGSQSPINGRSA